MKNKTTIRIKEYNSESGRYDDTGETLSTHTLARSMTSENFAALFDDFLNLGGKDFREGKEIGLQLRFTHRTLQRLAICFAFGIIVGLSEQEHTDARNETAIQTAQKVAEMLEASEFPLGLYI
ncbi:unnamed protein product [marine sediment metagenome]|uniref:Uncharacterized protein n=1 Tax=marine sediment metagenome TaxID=412755 RepID=X1DZS8_9ZZZZ